ncbi:amidohydrolase [Piscinibacter gummiphilus]|uniref:amidohydrolase n=1 Tax=Piscinibacter gummiphilus TaxID=946333 RepID=UPI000A27044A|nr:amidohydrolase [Piscinibacter gummiphilus]ATU64450.1 amidohydrolase [Piscinibacter gummiphilus]GLS95148.1 amidohydrolase [Piscinibacter gummiphilus]
MTTPASSDRRDFLQAAAAFGITTLAGPAVSAIKSDRPAADLILRNGRVTTFDPKHPEATAVALKDGLVMAVGTDAQMAKLADDRTRTLDVGRRRVIPGLTDSHNHIIRGGLNHNLELRWDGVRRLGAALEMLREQARRTPAPQWVRVVGGWSEFQFEEKRLPTLQEINEAAPDTPVFVLNLYNMAMLNRAALRAVGYTKDSAQPPGAIIERDARGEPTGLLLAEPNAFVLYNTLNMGPKLSPENQVNSTLQFMREENRLGVTSIGDAGGGFQNYPDDYNVIDTLARENKLTVRIAYNLFPQKAKSELADFQRWVRSSKPGQGTDLYKLNGAGEMLAFSAADFEDFLQPRPEMPASMEGDLEAVVRFLAGNGWPWRMHATYNETISRALDVFEKVHRDIPIDQLGWFFDHGETVTPANIERIRKLGGGIAVQNRMSMQGEYFIRRYGLKAAAETPPVKRMIEMGVPVTLGTDATRVNSYNPWQAIYWLVSGRSIGGTVLYPEERRLDRHTALSLMTANGAWFSRDTGKKGVLKPGAFGDVAVLDRDVMTVPEDEIQDTTSVLTIVAGNVVHGSDGFAPLAPPLPPASPDWSPVRTYGGYQARGRVKLGASTGDARYHYAAMCACASACLVHGHGHTTAALSQVPTSDPQSFWGALGCACAV